MHAAPIRTKEPAMFRPSVIRPAVAIAMAALAGSAAHAVEATQWNPERAPSVDASPARATAATLALATPRHFGEATEWSDANSRSVTRAAIVGEARQARRKGLLDDAGEAGATDRVLAQREAFIQQEHDRLVAERAAAEEAQRVAAAAVEPPERASDPILALLLIDDSDPTITTVYAYTPNDVSQWRATPVELPQRRLPAERPVVDAAPAPSSELRIDGRP
jgi:hypothetical protein